VEQVYNLPTQSITTKDDVTVTFSANIRFRISDVLLNLTEVHNFEASLEGAAMVHLAQRVRAWSWKELVENQKKLETSLADTLTTRVKRWGVEILEVGLTDLVKGKVYRFYGDPFKA
jgi:regulator of protease activity HflC (stomatin/prohibitin superfamily)